MAIYSEPQLCYAVGQEYIIAWERINCRSAPSSLSPMFLGYILLLLLT